MEKITAKTPWEPWMGSVPMHLEYFEGSMFDAVAKIAREYPQNIAFDFMGTPTSYPELIAQIERCAKALSALGIREGDKVTIGTIHKEELVMEDGAKRVRDVVEIGATLDERIADGFYFVRSLKLLKHVFAHPELLDQPIGQPSGFEYK